MVDEGLVTNVDAEKVRFAPGQHVAKTHIHTRLSLTFKQRHQIVIEFQQNLWISRQELWIENLHFASNVIFDL